MTFVMISECDFANRHLYEKRFQKAILQTDINTKNVFRKRFCEWILTQEMFSEIDFANEYLFREHFQKAILQIAIKKRTCSESEEVSRVLLCSRIGIDHTTIVLFQD